MQTQMIIQPHVSNKSTKPNQNIKTGQPLQFLTNQLTLSQPGVQIMPTTVLPAPPDFQTLRRACIDSVKDQSV